MFVLATVLSLVAFSNAGLLEHRTADSPDRVYLPPSSINSNTLATRTSTFVNTQIPTAAVRPIAIVRQANENNVDGTFSYSYETEDGQSAEARGQLQADGAEGIQTTQGSYSFTAPDGLRYTVTYTAGANGFEAQGAHLPVPPPIPEAILKSLADNAADEARGIIDDGSYREEGIIGQRTSVGVTNQQVNIGGINQVNYQRAQSGYQYQQPGPQGYQL